MSNKTTSLGLSENNEAQNANTEDNIAHINNPRIIIRMDNQSNVNNSENLGTGTVNTIAKDNKDTQDAKHDNSKTRQAKKLPEKLLCHSKIDTASYLISEFSDLSADVEGNEDATDKLPKYKDIEKGYSRKKWNNSKFSSVFRNLEKKRRIIYSKDTVTVQFFGSENIPENKVLMEYEPESRNFTVKGMFLVLSMIHFLIFLYDLLLFLTPAQISFRRKGYLFSIPPFVFLALTITLVICLERCRQPNYGCLIIFMLFACLSVAGAALAGYLETRFFIFSHAVLAFTDFTMGILGCFSFDYSNKLLYGIALGSGALYSAILIPVLQFGFVNLYYWQFLHQDTPLTYSMCVIFILVTLAAMVAELHFLLAGEWVELAEDDYVFGAFLLFIALIDFPLRMLRKYCTVKRDEDDEE